MNYKNKIRWTLILLIIFFSVTIYAFAYYHKHQAINSEVISITDYCRSRKEEAIKQKPQGFEGIVVEGENALQWKKVANHIEFPDASEGADVWLVNGNIVLVNMFLQARSSDWVNFSYYCYREDGTLAKLEGEFNTFHAEEGGVSVWNDDYYDAKGNKIAESTTIHDLQTKELISNRSYNKQEVQIYKTVEELPFLFLISKQ